MYYENNYFQIIYIFFNNNLFLSENNFSNESGYTSCKFPAGSGGECQ